MLPSERKRRAQRDAAEASGQDLWTEELPNPARVKIRAFLRGVAEQRSDFTHSVNLTLEFAAGRSVPYFHLDNLLGADNDFALDVVGAAAFVISDDARLRRDYGESFESFVNRILEDYRVAYRLVDGELFPVESDELHQHVVAPALRLLVGEQFARANGAYMDAIKEVPTDPSNAITDAGTALQETLTALGCEGNSLGPLIKSAKKQSLLAGHDKTLTSAIEDFHHWASADRSEKGDGHKVSDASRSDAWLMIHIVGALIIRLVDDAPRAEV